MNSNRYYSIPFDARNDVAMRLLRRKQGGIVAFGRWQALLGMLYDADGRIDLKDETMRDLVCEELELDAEGLDSFLADCRALDILSKDAWNNWTVVMSEGVLKEIDYRQRKSYAGKKGMEARWGRKEGEKES